MNRSGNCHDNAFIEGFWNIFKTELVDRLRFDTRILIRSEVFDYVETFSNRQLCPGALDCLSHVDFESQNNTIHHLTFSVRFFDASPQPIRRIA